MPAKSTDPTSFRTPAQLANYLHLSVDSLYKMRINGEGPPFVQLVARRFLYPIDATEEWLTKQRKLKVVPKPRRRRARLTAA